MTKSLSIIPFSKCSGNKLEKTPIRGEVTEGFQVFPVELFNLFSKTVER